MKIGKYITTITFKPKVIPIVIPKREDEKPIPVKIPDKKVEAEVSK